MDIHGVRAHVRGMVADGTVSSEEATTLRSWGITSEQVDGLRRNLADGGGLTDKELIAVIYSTNTTLNASVQSVAAPTNPAKLAPPSGITSSPTEPKPAAERGGDTKAPASADPIAELATRQRAAATDAFRDGSLSTSERTALQGLEISSSQIDRLQSLAASGGRLSSGETMSVLNTGAVRDRRASLERAKARDAAADRAAGYTRPGVAEAMAEARRSATGRRILDELDRRNIPIRFMPDAEFDRRSPGAGGYYNFTKGEIVLPERALKRPDQMLAVIIHEASHAIESARAKRDPDFMIETEVRAYADTARAMRELGMSWDEIRRSSGGFGVHPTEDRLLTRRELDTKIRRHPLYAKHDH